MVKATLNIAERTDDRRMALTNLGVSGDGGQARQCGGRTGDGMALKLATVTVLLACRAKDISGDENILRRSAGARIAEILFGSEKELLFRLAAPSCCLAAHRFHQMDCRINVPAAVWVYRTSRRICATAYQCVSPILY